MDYSNKTLVAAGCSHTYGQFLGNINETLSHDRSWVRKLERMAGFKSSINLAQPGASNKRSFRVLTDFLLKNINNLSDYVFMMGTTELFRTEMPSQIRLNLYKDRFSKEPYYINLIQPCAIDFTSDDRIRDFLELYFGLFSVDAYERKMMNHDMLRFHIFLNHYQVEHYFPVMMGSISEFESKVGNLTLPYIRFNGQDAFRELRDKGFKMGADVEPDSDCRHYDHDGHEYMAKVIYQSMTNLKDKNNV